MTNAHHKTNAAARAKGRLARLARHGAAMALLACAGLGAAHAQYHGRRDDPQTTQATPAPAVPARAERQPPQLEPRSYEQQQRAYEQQRADEQRRQAAQTDASREGARRAGRLTPDERRDLRRQINEAGMDIYPNAQRR